jgi:hypothetical protein
MSDLFGFLILLSFRFVLMALDPIRIYAVWQFNVRKSPDTCVERLDSECFVLMQNY